MSAFMCSIQVTNSDRSRGLRGSRTRCTTTPSISSSGGDSSWPRVSTCTSTSWRTRFSDSLRTCRASPPSINGGYSQDRIRARKLIGSSSYAEQGRDVELRREVAEVRIVDRPRVSQSIEGSDQLGVVLLDTPERVVAGHFVRVLERPVARLEGEQLARGALQGRVARACARGGGDRAQLGAARRPGDLRDARRVPGRQVLRPAPRRLDERALRDRLVALERVRQRGQREALEARLVDHEAQPVHALVPPVAEQLGVEREAAQARPAALVAVGVEAGDRALDEVARVRAGALEGLVVTGRLCAPRPRPPGAAPAAPR